MAGISDESVGESGLISEVSSADESGEVLDGQRDLGAVVITGIITGDIGPENLSPEEGVEVGMSGLGGELARRHAEVHATKRIDSKRGVRHRWLSPRVDRRGRSLRHLYTPFATTWID